MNNVLLTESNIAYSAGFFDGEGSINISMQTRKGGRAYHMLACTACQRVIWPLEKLKSYFGGSIKIKKTPKGKIAYNWQIVSKEAENFLKMIRQFSVVKSEEIDIALEFRSTVQDPNERTSLGQVPPLKSEMVRRRNEFVVRLLECREKKYA